MLYNQNVLKLLLGCLLFLLNGQFAVAQCGSNYPGEVYYSSTSTCSSVNYRTSWCNSPNIANYNQTVFRSPAILPKPSFIPAKVVTNKPVMNPAVVTTNVSRISPPASVSTPTISNVRYEPSNIASPTTISNPVNFYLPTGTGTCPNGRCPLRQ